jgi:hypothetical protein
MEPRQALSVLLVFTLLGGALVALRRGRLGLRDVKPLRWGSLHWSALGLRAAQAKTRSLSSIDRLVLTPHHSLHLVRIQGREVVVATHPHGCSVFSSEGILLSDDPTVLNDGCRVFNAAVGPVRS